MRAGAVLAALLGTAMAAPSYLVSPRAHNKGSLFTPVHPGPIKNMMVTKENTLNGTRHHAHGTSRIRPLAANESTATLPLSFVNNMGDNINAYITGKDSTGAVCFVAADGSLIYPSSGGSDTPVPVTDNIAIPISASSTGGLTIPTALDSARVYFAQGELSFAMVATGNGDGLVQPAPNVQTDPSSGINWGFVELTLLDDGTVYANISYVDFVGIILGMSLAVNGGDTQSTLGLPGDAVTSICNDLATQQAADGYPWASLCMADGNGNPLRVLSPNDYTSIDDSSFADYYTDYVNQVWSQYSSAALTINTQTDAGDIACQVSGDTMTCDGDNRGYAMPSAADIWGCNSGPFGQQDGDNGIHLAVIPRLCAAFDRTTLLLEGGNTQPALDSSNYYTVDPTNHYSRIIHTYETDGRGYAFSYDDVNPDGNENASGTVSSGTPGTLTIYIGGSSS